MVFDPLLAYVGPGPGLTMLWAFVILLGTICLSVLYLLSWPLRLLIRRLRGGESSAGAEEKREESTGTPSKRE